MTFSGGASELIFPANALPAGEIEIIVKLDPEGWVIETDETNNQKTCRVTVK